MRPYFEYAQLAWQRTKRDFTQLLVLAILSLVLFGIAMPNHNNIHSIMNKGYHLSFFREVILIVSTSFVHLLWSYYTVKADEQAGIKIGTLFSTLPLNTLLSFIVSTFIFNLAISIGIVLLILPGLYIMIKFCFYGFSLLLKRAGPFEALKDSFVLTNNRFWDVSMALGAVGLFAIIPIFGLFCVMLLCMFFTLPAPIIAVILTILSIPIFAITFGILYNGLYIVYTDIK